MTDLHINPPAWADVLPRLTRYLSASQARQLRDLPSEMGPTDELPPHVARTLRDTLQALKPLQRVLINYMPRYLIELDPTPGQPHGEILEGSFMFADVSGFTALTEMLSREGQARGPEMLNQIINSLFETVLDPLITSGGDLLIFAGDAVLAYFPAQPDGEDVRQAIRAALRIQRAIVPFANMETDYGPCSLTMSIGLDRGLAYAGVVGTDKRMELLVSGPGTLGATQAEIIAQSGQVVLGEQAQTFAANHFTMDGAMVLDDLGDTLDDFEILPPKAKRGRESVMMSSNLGEILLALDKTLERIEQLAPFLPEDMLARLVNSERRRQLAPELRPVTIQFLNLLGLEELATTHGSDFATQVFQRYFVKLQDIVSRHEGVISQIDAYSDGFFIVNTYGAPTMHEGTKRYAVAAALAQSEALKQVNRDFKLDPPLQQRSGITHGLIFTGEIGAQYRRESVIAGPAVNRAARLMSKANPGQVILDADIWQDTHAVFVGEQLPALKLKGIENPVVIINVREVRLGTRLQPLKRPLLERTPLQTQLGQALTHLSERGSAWLIKAETGLGKTALVSDLATTARQAGLKVLVGGCQPHGRNIALFPWIDLLTGWLDTDGTTTPQQQANHLSAALAGLDLASLRDTLIDLLELPPPQSPGTPSDLRDKLRGRSASVMDLIWEQLEWVSSAQAIERVLTALAPAVVIIEDMHWADDESLALLPNLITATTAHPLMLVLTSNQYATFEHPALQTVTLPPLSHEAVAQVAQRVLGARGLDDSLATWICHQAGGNPLYAAELSQALMASNSVFVDRDIGEARWIGLTPALPLSLHQLLLARFDQLPLLQREVLMRGAVIGQSFSLDGVHHLAQKQLTPVDIQTAIEGTVEASFLTALADNTFRFNHPLMQETIYTTLSFAQKQRWHTTFADWLVKNANGDLPLELVAYHYVQGDAPDQAAHYSRLAGDSARAQGSYTVGLGHYQKVLTLTESPANERRAAAEGAGDILAIQGYYDLALTAYQMALDGNNPPAAVKHAIISQDIAALETLSFPEYLRGWGLGSRAWHLALTDNTEAALSLAQDALTRADATSQAALNQLVKTLMRGDTPAPYTHWLQEFAKGVLVSTPR